MSADLFPAKRALLALLGGRWPDRGVSGPQWPDLMDMAAAHRLEPLLAWRVEREGWELPAGVAAAWQSARRKAGLAALAQQAALRLTFKRLHAAGIEAVALKGVPLVWRHYPEPGLRPMRDIDLLVSDVKACEAAAILTEAGFNPDVDDADSLTAAIADDHQLPAQTRADLGVTIELHHRLTDPPHRRGYWVPQLPPEAMLARSATVDCGGFAVRCPAPQDLAAHLIVHALYGHRLDCGPLVLADLHFLGVSGEVDWDRLRTDADVHGWLRGADLLLALTTRWFGPLSVAFEPPPDSVLVAAENSLLPDPAARGHSEVAADFAAARSSAAFVRALGRRLTPDPHVVADEGGGRPAWTFWPIWAGRRLAGLGRRLGDRRASSEARSAAQVMRWLQD